jgi:RND family efflux transporter MFP subunit
MARAKGGAFLVLLLGLAGLGCSGQASPRAEPKLLKVQVSAPVVQSVTDYETFSGRTEAVESTDIRARVSGYLKDITFADGAFVEAGAVLFEIDPRPYEAALLRARANVAQAKAAIRQGEFSVAHSQSNLSYLSAEYERNRRLMTSRTVSSSELDKSRGEYTATAASVEVARANVEVARASLKAAEAEEQTAQLNLDFTRVTAPFAGVVSRRFVDRGALVTADTTILTNIARVDQIDAYFDVDERTWLSLRRQLLRDGQLTSIPKAVLPVSVGLANDTGHPFAGQVNFADNKLDASTGTMRMRGTFDNPKLYLQPGMFVRVRLPVGQPRQALLVAEQAIGNDQGRQFLYVLDANDEVVYRRVELGALHDGLREIKAPGAEEGTTQAPTSVGLRQGDRVVLNGLQRLRPGMKVQPDPVAMPNPRQAASGKKGEPGA